MTTLYIIYKKKGFKIPAPPSYEDLISLLTEYKEAGIPSGCSLRYEDSDQDLVMLSSDEDYKAMIDSEKQQIGIKVYLDDGGMDPEDTEFELIDVGKPNKRNENSNQPKYEPLMDESVPPKLQPFKEFNENNNNGAGCFKAHEVYLEPNQVKVIPDPSIQKNENYSCHSEIILVDPFQKENNQPFIQQIQPVQQPSIKLEDIRDTMIDVLKNNFPDVLSLSLKNILPVQQPQLQPTGIDKKLKTILRTLLTSYRDQSHFERAKIDEALGGAPGKLLSYFEDDEDIIPPIPVVKKKDSENVDIYNPNKNKNHVPIPQPIKKIPEVVEEKKVEEKKIEPPKPSFEKSFDINDVNATSVIFKPADLEEKKKNYIPDYSCEFVREVSTLPKNLTVSDSTILKTISLRNNGTKKWPEGSTLEYFDGLKFKAVKMAALEAGKDFQTVIQIESPKMPGTFSCFLNFACPVFNVMTYPNEPFELSVSIEGKPAVVDNELPKDWIAKINAVKVVIPDADEKKIVNMLTKNPKISIEEIINQFFI